MSNLESSWEELPPEVRKELKKQMKAIWRKIKSGEIKPINPRTALKNSFFPTLVKRALKGS